MRYGQSEYRIYAQNIIELERELNRIFGNNDNIKKQIILIIIRETNTKLNYIRERNVDNQTAKRHSVARTFSEYFSTDTINSEVKCLI